MGGHDTTGVFMMLFLWVNMGNDMHMPLHTRIHWALPVERVSPQYPMNNKKKPFGRNDIDESQP